MQQGAAELRVTARTVPFIRSSGRPRVSVTTPPASRTITAPAAMSQALTLCSRVGVEAAAGDIGHVDRAGPQTTHAGHTVGQPLHLGVELFLARLAHERDAHGQHGLLQALAAWRP